MLELSDLKLFQAIAEEEVFLEWQNDWIMYNQWLKAEGETLHYFIEISSLETLLSKPD